MQFKQYAWFTGRAARYTDAQVAAGQTHLSADAYKREANNKITRGQAVALSMDTLYSPMANKTQILAQKLISHNVFTQEKWEMVRSDFEDMKNIPITSEPEAWNALGGKQEEKYSYTCFGSLNGILFLERQNKLDYTEKSHYLWRKDFGIRELPPEAYILDFGKNVIRTPEGAYVTGSVDVAPSKLFYVKQDGTIETLMENCTHIYRADGNVYVTDYVDAIDSIEWLPERGGNLYLGGQTVFQIDASTLTPIINLPKSNPMRITKHISNNGKTLIFEVQAIHQFDNKTTPQPWIIQWDGKHFQLLDLPTYIWKKDEFMKNYQKELDTISKIL